MARSLLLTIGLVISGFLGGASEALAQGAITVAWAPNPEADIAGYILEYGQSSGQYPDKEDVGNRTFFTLSGLSPGVTHYIAVRAYNYSGLQSPPSAEVVGIASTVAVVTTGDGAPVVNGWPTRSVAYQVNPSNQDVTELEALAAVQVGASVWTQQSAAAIELVYAGPATTTKIGLDSVNNVIFRPEENGDAVASTYLWVSGSGAIVDADVVFWDGEVDLFTGVSGCAGGAYIEDVTAHAFGHVLGLGHASDPADTMHETQLVCSTSPRTLSASDIAAIEALYPPLGEVAIPPVP